MPEPTKAGQHTQGELHRNGPTISGADGGMVATCFTYVRPAQEVEANAARLVLCWNEHDKVVAQRDELVEAAKSALSHVRELEDAWLTGAIRETDGNGGTRSTRNTEVRLQLSDALFKAGIPNA